MKSISGKDFTKLLEQNGWLLKRTHGSHYIYSHPQKTAIISVPVHKNMDLKIGLLKNLMKIADLNEGDL